MIEIMLVCDYVGIGDVANAVICAYVMCCLSSNNTDSSYSWNALIILFKSRIMYLFLVKKLKRTSSEQYVINGEFTGSHMCGCVSKGVCVCVCVCLYNV